MDWTWATEFNLPVVSAFLLGLITAIAPCPMTTNIAAVAYISRQTTSKKYAIITGGLYTLGRMFTYTLIGIILVVVGAEITGISTALQVAGSKILGPLLIVIGILMFFIDKISFGRGGRLSSLSQRVAGWGPFGGFALGAIFAAAFCPYSAVLVPAEGYHTLRRPDTRT